MAPKPIATPRSTVSCPTCHLTQSLIGRADPERFFDFTGPDGCPSHARHRFLDFPELQEYIRQKQAEKVLETPQSIYPHRASYKARLVGVDHHPWAAAKPRGSKVTPSWFSVELDDEGCLREAFYEQTRVPAETGEVLCFSRRGVVLPEPEESKSWRGEREAGGR